MKFGKTYAITRSISMIYWKLKSMNWHTKGKKVYK